MGKTNFDCLLDSDVSDSNGTIITFMLGLQITLSLDVADDFTALF